ncbi:hypothetical protein [Anaerorhabdus sp.]|uniref:hypothetical protein n=1 Tax=Anaerorhabdus sp. TaxID=1872524 RepID=UPI002FC65A0F
MYNKHGIINDKIRKVIDYIMENKKTFGNILDSAVLILVCSAIGYLCGYSYLNGYLEYYGLIGINSEITFYILSKSLVLLAVFVLITLTIISFLTQYPIFILEKYLDELYYIDILIAIIYFLNYFLGLEMKYFYTLLYFIIPINIWTLARNIVLKKKGKSSRLKDSNEESKSEEISESIIHKKVSQMFMIFFGILIFYNFCFSMGINDAKVKKDYLVSDRHPGYVIVYNDNNNYFLARQSEGVILHEYLILNSENLGNIKTINIKLHVDNTGE